MCLNFFQSPILKGADPFYIPFKRAQKIRRDPWMDCVSPPPVLIILPGFLWVDGMAGLGPPTNQGPGRPFCRRKSAEKPAPPVSGAAGPTDENPQI